MAAIHGKIACITGGLGSIGFEFAKALIQHGIKGLILVDINERRAPEALSELKKLGEAKVLFLGDDLTSVYQIECAMKKGIKEFGQLDILINNANILSEDNYEKMVAINYVSLLYGTMLALYRYFPKYKSGSHGVIVNVASIFGLQPGYSTPMYTACNHAIIAIGRAFGSPYYYNRYKSSVLTMCHGITTDTLSKERENLKEFVEEVRCYRRQRPACCGQCLIKMLEKPENGSIWISESGKCYKWKMEDSYDIRNIRPK